MKQKILILGGSSLLSVNIAFFFRKKFNLFLACNTKKPKITHLNSFFAKFNYKDLNFFITKIKPEIVIISSANTNIENCEKNKKKTLILNFELVRIVSKLSKIHKFKVIFFSTDQVYESKEYPSNESSGIKALNYYSKSKILAENYIKKNLQNYLILRTNFFGYGPNYRKSFSDLIIENSNKKLLKYYFADNKFSSIYLPYLIRSLEKLIRKKVSGVYNLCSPNYLSKYEFAIEMSKRFNLNINYIKKGYLKNAKLIKRPLNMSMSNKKLEKKINFKIPKIQFQISLMKKDYNKEYFLFMKNLKVIRK